MENHEEIIRLNERIDTLEKRLELLEYDNLKLKEKLKMEREVIERPKTVKQTVTVKRKDEPVKQKQDFEKLIGQVWLPRIFIFVLLLGVVWAFKAASSNGILTEPVKVMLGFLFAVLFYWLGERQIKHNRKALGLVLLGGTVTLLVLTTFAAHNLYGYLPAVLAFILNIFWIVAGLVLSNKHKSEPLSIFVAIGGYLVPFLIENSNPNPLVFTGYELLLYLSLFLLAVKRNYIILFYLALYLLHIVYIVYYLITGGLGENLLISGIVIQHTVILWHFVWKTNRIQHLLITIFGNFILFLGWLYMIYDGRADWAALGIFVIYGLLAYYFKGRNNNDKFAVAATVASFSLLVFLVNYIETDVKAGLIVVEGTLIIFLGLHFKSIIKQVSGFIVYVVGAGIILDQEIGEIFSSRTLNWLLLLITILVIHNLYRKYKGAYSVELERSIITGTVSVFLLLLLYFASQVTGVLTKGLSFNMSQMALSFVWALYSVGAISFGIFNKVKGIRLFGIGMLFVTLLKLIFIDLPSVSIVIRAILFIVVGIIGVAISRLYYSKKSD